MSGKKKIPEKSSSKISILNYFAPANCVNGNSPPNTNKKTTSIKNNRISRKRTTKQNTCTKEDKSVLLSTNPKKLKLSKPNLEPIIISSDESADENVNFENIKKQRKSSSIYKRKSRRKSNITENENEEGVGDVFILKREKKHLKLVKEIELLSDSDSSCEDAKENDLLVPSDATSNLPISGLIPTKNIEAINSENNSVTKTFYENLQTSNSDSLDEAITEENKTEKIAYYLLNFRQILDTVLGNDDDRALFEGTDDITWINKFNDLPLSAQKLYVRLYHRKTAWLRLEQVNYPDISGKIHLVLKRLADDGFLVWFDENNKTNVELNEILKLLPAPSLKELAKSYKINVNGRQKTQIAEDLRELCRKQRSVLGGFFNKKSQKDASSKSFGLAGNVMKRACKILGPCYKIAPYPRTVFNRVLLVFDVTRGIDDETECTLTGSQNAMGQGRHLQLSAILMAGMGKVTYPSCTVDRPTPIFGKRSDLLHYETAFQFQSDILSCVEAGQWQEASVLCDTANSIRIDIKTNDKESSERTENLPEFLRCFTAQWTYMRLRSLEVEILQRLKNYKKAVEILKELLDQRIYCTSRRGHWWERLALNIDQHLKDSVQSLDVIYESLQDNDVRVGHKLALAQRVNKILTSRSVKKLPQLTTTYKEKLKPIIDRLEIEEAPVVEITGRLLPSDVQTGKSRFVTTECEGNSTDESTLICSVEELALSHYRNLGFDRGIHGEGGTFSTLFCLFLWDIIFMPGIPDVFRTSYQTHPLDFHTDDFYLKRKDVIEKRLKQIEDMKENDFNQAEEVDDSPSTPIDILTLTWDTEFGNACAGMNWERFESIEEAKGLVSCIGGKVLSGIFRRFAKDLRHTRSGLPDLVAWNTVDKTYKMVEVKGPGDRLSTNQKLWIDELIKLGANIEVCKVIAIGGKRLTRD